MSEKNEKLTDQFYCACAETATFVLPVNTLAFPLESLTDRKCVMSISGSLYATK